MIGTHSPKMFNARVKQGALRAQILKPNRDLISSATIALRKTHWSLPRTAADIRIFSDIIETGGIPAANELPDLEDPNIKQILLPMGEDKYVCATPVPSCGVSYEVFRRTKEQGLKTWRWIIQPTAATLSSHGQGLLMQGGSVRLLVRGSHVTERKPKWRGLCVQLTCRVERMNISSGMVAAGWPAMTAIGGMIHAVERTVGFELEFAFGMKHCEWSNHVPKFSVNKTASGRSTGRVEGKTVTVSPGFSTEEITGTGEIVLLVRPKIINATAQYEAIENALYKLNRIAGGSVFEPNVKILRDERPDEAVFLMDYSRRAKRIQVDEIPHKSDSPKFEREPDLLDKALFAYGQPYSVMTLNPTAYEFLEKPQYRTHARNREYPHVWCEQTFSVVALSRICASAWWGRHSTESGVYFSRAKRKVHSSHA